MLSAVEVTEVLNNVECPDVCMMYDFEHYFESCNFSEF